MSKTYRPWNPDQDWLLPPSPREWLAEGDLVLLTLNFFASREDFSVQKT